MKVRKVLKKRIQTDRDGVAVAGDVQAAIAANVGEPGRSTVSVSSTQQVVQRGGRRATTGGGGREASRRGRSTKRGTKGGSDG